MILFVFGRIYTRIIKAVFLSKISPKQDFNINRAYFFLFCDLDFMYYLVTFGGIHENKLGKKNIESFNLFFFEFHEYHLWFSNFVAKIFREYHQKWQHYMKSRSRNKKNMHGLYWNLALVIFWTKIQLVHISFHHKSNHDLTLFFRILSCLLRQMYRREL